MSFRPLRYIILNVVKAMGSYHEVMATHVLVLPLTLTAWRLNIQPVQKSASPLTHGF